jgi:hypothetical protein
MLKVSISFNKIEKLSSTLKKINKDAIKKERAIQDIKIKKIFLFL